MKRTWNKSGENSYTFSFDNMVKGTMTIDLNSINRKGIILYGEKEYSIYLTGSWNNAIEIADKNGAIIAKAFYEKWYANSMVLEYNNHHFKLVIRNNPLAEWAILKDDQTVLAYGLSAENGRAAVKISSSAQTDYLFDFILWYLFVPIATENSFETFLFLML